MPARGPLSSMIAVSLNLVYNGSACRGIRRKPSRGTILEVVKRLNDEHHVCCGLMRSHEFLYILSA